MDTRPRIALARTSDGNVFTGSRALSGTRAPARARFGRFEIVACLGRGGTANVYRAREIGSLLDRDVCLKRLATALSEADARALREEASVLSRVTHGNVVSLFGVEEHAGEPALVLELVSGGDLRTFTRAIGEKLATPGLLPDGLAVHVACAVLRALGAVQRALPGLVHRDVTPHNVLVSTEGEVKLADFGIALVVGRARSTSPCLVKGKLGYLAPEQLRGEEVDPRADLFSLGVVLHELLTRTRPWGSVRGSEQLTAIACGTFRSIQERRRDLAPSLARAVDRLLAPSPDLRFADADEALYAFAPHSAGDLGPIGLASLARRCGVTPVEDHME